jgi:hypothetical protein
MQPEAEPLVEGLPPTLEVGEVEETAEEIEPVVEMSEAPSSEITLGFTRPYALAPPFTGEVSDLRLAEYAVQVVEAEGPIHHELLLVRLRLATPYARAGANVRTLLEGAIQAAARSGGIRRGADAWVSPKNAEPAPRNWSGCPAAQRKLEYLPEVEISAALRLVIGNAYGIGKAAAAREALALLGFRRATEKGLERTLGILNGMIAAGAVIEREEGVWMLPTVERGIEV